MTATTKEKAVNYSDEMINMMVEKYTTATNEQERDDVVNSLVVELGKGRRSIVARLSKSGVYVSKDYKAKTGEKPVRKNETAEAICKVLGLSVEAHSESLSKVTKVVLQTIFKALADSKPLEN